MSKSLSFVVFEISGSPVRVDSFTCSDTASSSVPSAGISSPVPKTTMSPTTTSFLGTSWMLPFRITLTMMSSFTVFKMSKALFAFISNTKPTQLASMMAKKIPIGSRNAEMPFASGPQQWTPAMTMESTHAISSILIIGSLNFSRNWLHKEAFSGGVKMFAPYFFRLSSTSAGVNPLYCFSPILFESKSGCV